MPSYPALELSDVLRVQSLFVLPSSSARATQSRVPGSARNGARLAPIEMAAPSIHIASSAPAQSLPPPPSKNSQGTEAADWCAVLCNPATPDQDRAQLQKARHLSSAVWVPLGYITCGLTLLLCHLMAPGYPSHCIIILSPVWTLTLALHAISMMHDQVWVWLGLLAILMLPFTILLSDRLFGTFYLFVFTAFSSGRFWQALHGPFFLGVGLCWFALASSLALGVALGDHPIAYQALACFFALSAGCLSASRLGRLSYSVDHAY